MMTTCAAVCAVAEKTLAQRKVAAKKIKARCRMLLALYAGTLQSELCSKRGSAVAGIVIGISARI
jgi:hypothetical protein